VSLEVIHELPSEDDNEEGDADDDERRLRELIATAETPKPPAPAAAAVRGALAKGWAKSGAAVHQPPPKRAPPRDLASSEGEVAKTAAVRGAGVTGGSATKRVKGGKPPAPHHGCPANEQGADIVRQD
jgi:hypothetical protein